MPSRRNVLIGLGGLMAGGGALFATGAFTTVEAQRTMNVETAGDADAFLGLTPADGSPFVTVDGDGMIEINLDEGAAASGQGLNQNSRFRFQRLVTVENNGTQDVTSLTIDIDSTETFDIGNTFQIVVSDEGDTTIPLGDNLLGSTDPGGDADLKPDQTVDFGLFINLVDGGDGDGLPEDGDYTMVIEAETAESP